jgi:hypothetical protein
MAIICAMSFSMSARRRQKIRNGLVEEASARGASRTPHEASSRILARSDAAASHRRDGVEHGARPHGRPPLRKARAK